MTQRNPKAKALVSGAALRNPSRYKGRGGPLNPLPLGDPPARLSASEVAVWCELRDSLPWLNRSHRTIVQLACHLAARLDSGKEVGVSAMRALSAILSKLGATPVDEPKVNFGTDADDDDDTELFFRRPS
jgi:hypothetical protein